MDRAADYLDSRYASGKKLLNNVKVVVRMTTYHPRACGVGEPLARRARSTRVPGIFIGHRFTRVSVRVK